MNRAFNVVRNAFSTRIRRAENAQIEERAQSAAEEARQRECSRRFGPGPWLHKEMPYLQRNRSVYVVVSNSA